MTPPAPSAHPGYPQFFGRYKLLMPLGRGGMGQVALAVTGDTGLETVCVVKRVAGDLRSEPAIVKRFFDEANLARKLAHRNLVRTQEIASVDGELGIVQEFVEGYDLSQVVLRARKQMMSVPVSLAIHIISEVARGLAYAHAFDGLGLVHRDVSPPNVRLSYAGEVKLMDFGIAKSAIKTFMTAPGKTVGKLAYMAPEQLAGGTVDRRADIYSLGVVLWELLTGKDAAALPARPGTKFLSFPPPSAEAPGIPGGIDGVIAQALAIDTEKRFASAGDLVDCLWPILPIGFDGQAAVADFLARLFDVEKDRAALAQVLAPAAPPDTDVAAVTAMRSGGGRRRLAIGALVAVVALGAGIVSMSTSGPAKKIPVAEIPARSLAPAAAPQAAGELAPTPSAPPAVARALLLPAAAASATSVSRPLSRPVARPAPAPVASTLALPPSASPAAAPSKESLTAQAREAFLRDDFSTAIAIGERAVMAGEGAGAHLMLGNVYLRQRRYREAEAAYAQVLRERPGDEDARRRRDIVKRILETPGGPP